MLSFLIYISFLIFFAYLLFLIFQFSFFVFQIYVPPPDEESRSQILQIELKKMPTSFSLPPYKILENKIGENIMTPISPTSGEDFETKLNDFVFHKILDENKNNNLTIDHSCESVNKSNYLVENIPEHNDLEGYDLLYDLINRTKGFSGAEMVSVVQEAGMLAIDEMCEELKLEHLYSAISGIQPQITNEMLLFYKNIAKNY